MRASRSPPSTFVNFSQEGLSEVLRRDVSSRLSCCWLLWSYGRRKMGASLICQLYSRVLRSRIPVYNIVWENDTSSLIYLILLVHLFYRQVHLPSFFRKS